MRQIVSEIFDPATRYEFEPATPSDIVRALQIDAKFEELELGLVDGTVAAVAERRGVSRVLTADRADFNVIRVGPRYQRALTLLPSTDGRPDPAGTALLGVTRLLQAHLPTRLRGCDG